LFLIAFATFLTSAWSSLEEINLDCANTRERSPLCPDVDITGLPMVLNVPGNVESQTLLSSSLAHDSDQKSEQHIEIMSFGVADL
jgi:hypothetical protein